MNRYFQIIITSLFIFFIAITSVFAQPSIIIDNTTAPANSNVTVDVRLSDIDFLSHTRFSLNWDPNQLEFLNVSNLNADFFRDFNLMNFNLDGIEDGNLVVEWKDEMLDAIGGQIEERKLFFQATFKTIGIEGEEIPINISNEPETIVMIRGEGEPGSPDDVGNNTFLFPAIITLVEEIPDVFFKIAPQEEKSTLCQGDQICYNVEVTGFTDILSITSSIGWDSSVIKFVGASDFRGIENLANFNVPFDSMTQTFSNVANLFYFDFQTASTLTLPDSTSIVTMCFEVVGDPGATTQIDLIAENPQEILNSSEEAFEVFSLNPPNIVVSDCQSLIIFSIECQDIRSEETVCFDFTTSNFEDIGTVKYTISWDPTLLEFVNTDNYNLPNLTGTNFSEDNGLLTLDWSDVNGATLPNGDFLFSACFKAIGPIDSINQLNFIDIVGGSVGHEIRTSDGNQLDSPQFNNCEVIILPPTIDLSAPTASFLPGEEICLPLIVTNFMNIGHVEMPVEWDPTVLEFININATGLTGLTIGDFDTSDATNGQLQLITWDSPNAAGVTLVDGASIYEICFRVIGDLGTTSPLSFPNIEDNPVFFIRNNNVKKLDINITNGLITAASGGLILTSEPKEVKEAESFCVDIQASNFNDIVSIDYSHVYDPAVLRFDSVQFSGALSGLSTEDVVLTADGNIKVIWFSTEPSGATSLADETSLYTLCFTAIGGLGDCANFNLGETIDVTTLESAGADVGIFNRLSDLCIDNFGLTLIDSLLPTCEGGDGFLNINVGGDEGERFFYFATKDGESIVINEDVVDNTILLENLSEGEYCIILSSITNPSKSDTKCFRLILGPEDLPSITLGEDIDAGCVAPTALLNIPLDGSQFTLPQNTSGSFSTTWEATNGGNILEGEENNQISTATTPGTYIFTVTINSTKCVASDTLIVFVTQPPRVQVGPGGTLGCTNSTIQLGLEVIDENPNNIYFWTTDVGNFVSDSTAFDPVVDKEGIYKFTVLDTVNGCFGVDSAFIFEDRIKPNASAGADLEMGCNDDFLVLTGVGSNGAEVEWTTPNGSSIFYPNVEEQETAYVTRVGTYIFTATNQVNGCMASDTMTINADNSLPVAQVDNLAIIGCGADAVKLDGSNSSQGPSFAYRWEDPTNEFISEEDTVIASTPGNYLLIVTNIDNDDCISDTVVVDVREDKMKPLTSITEILTLNCMSDCTELTANVPEGDQYTYEWTSDDGVFCGGENLPTVQINAIGVYRILVTDLNNNCESTAAAIVGGDGTEIFADPGPDRQIDCTADVVTLDGRGSTNGENISYSWKTAAGIEISTENMAAVNEAGEYTLEIADSETGCNATSTVTVTLDQIQPLAEAGVAPEVSGCVFPPGRRLNGNESDRGDNIVYAWTSTSGNLVGDTTIAAPEIAGPGLFTLTVTNTANGCVDTDEVLVQSDVIIPLANAGADVILTCDNPMANLAGISETPPQGSIINWSTTDGNIIGETDQLSLNVDAPGTYLLTIISPDMCEDTDEVVVSSNVDLPLVDAGIARTITCNQPLIINGFGTTGNNIDINWTTTGGNILSGRDTYTPEVDRGGSYTLTVTNLDNNCKNTALVLITADEPLPDAIAGNNQEICTNETILNAELPTGGFSGIWSTLENSLVLNPENPTTNVADLATGTNTYIWTLSSDNCGAFSSDTLTVNVPNMPIAENDVFQLEAGSGFNTVNLIENDQIGTNNININILEDPTTGSVAEVGNGVFEFITPQRYYGTQQFVYEVCSQACSELCDVANVRVIVLPGAGVDTTNTVPNAITPNGDGMNDLLLVDELIFDAIDFPRSEMIIFNRWGDVVYSASPYNNDWGGKSNSGVDLPEGTYYYVLRLDIVEGEVMRGDITILR